MSKLPNEAIKAAAEAVATPLANAATACLRGGELPECFKATTTVVLRKAKKKTTPF